MPYESNEFKVGSGDPGQNGQEVKPDRMAQLHLELQGLDYAKEAVQADYDARMADIERRRKQILKNLG